MKNTEMMTYDFVEMTECQTLMPEVMKTCGTIGASEETVHMHGVAAKGHDSLEVVDIPSFYE